MPIGIVLMLLALAMTGSASAAIFGVPTALDAAGAPTAGSANPPGWFVLTGTAAANADGDTVHQLRLFIEVTGTTLDITVFDPGNSGSRDLVRGGASQTTFQLLDPCTPFPTCTGALRSQITGFGDDTATTDNHLVRFTPANAGFVALNSGNNFTGLSAGLYEFRITMVNASDDVNHFGVDIHLDKSAAGFTTPYNVFTLGDSNAPDTAMMVSVDQLSGAPVAAISDPITFFPYITRGCTFQVSNYDMDITTFGVGSTGTIRDAFGNLPPVQGNAAGTLTMSDVAVHSENTVTIESTAATNLDSLDYGMYTLANNPGSCGPAVCGTNSRVNFIDWRFADFRAAPPATAPWNDNPANLPRDPIDSFRTYLPTAYTVAAGVPTVTAPSEPVLGTSARVVSGPNPPVAGSATRFLLTTSVYNTTGAAITNLQLSIGQPAGVVYIAATQAGFLDGAAAACTDGSGTGFRRCTFANVPANQVATLNIEVNVTPPGTGLMNLTGPPAVAPTIAVTALARLGTVATATSAGHPYQVGDYVVMAGANQTEYNGRFQITATTAATFSYSIVGAPTTPATGTFTATESCPDSGVCAHYTPTSSSAAFPRVDNLGPVCQMVLNVGTGGALATRATVRGLRVSPGVVEFATGTQHETAAFNLYAAPEASGRTGLVRLNASPIRAAQPNSLTPVLYRVETAPLPTRYLVIEEIDLRGRRHFMGPFDWTEPRLRASFERLEARLDEAGTPSGRKVRMVPSSRASRLARRGWSAERPRSWRRSGLGVKVLTRGAGRVEVPLQELRDAGLPAHTPLARLVLTSQGAEVPFDLVGGPDGAPAALAFQAEALATDYSDRNVYVVTWGRDLPDGPVTLTRSGDPLPDGVTRVERNLVYVSDLAQGADPWVWDLLAADGSSWPYDWDPEVGDFDLPGRPGDLRGDVTVAIRLVGRTTHRHTVDAFINGEPVGSITFDGAVPALLAGHVDAAVLQSHGNHLSLAYRGSGGEAGDVPLVYLSQLDLGFRSGPGTSPASYEIEDFDVRLAGVASAEYLIVTHPLFAEAAERIASLKQHEGLDAQVVDVERVYDRFSAGIADPEAIRALLRQAAQGRRLRYVLLLGGDTFDPRDYSGTGARSFVPSLVAWDGEFGRVPSENLYADVDGDGRPDLAIGRLPAETPEEAAVLAEKIARQAAALRESAGRQLFAVDNQAPGDISFRGAAETAALRLPPGTPVAWSDLTDGVSAAQQALRQGVARGAAMVHYFGHAGPEIWADEGLLTRDEVDVLAGTPESVLFTWACEAQWYQYLFGDTINEALLLLPRGGALASFGPAGITDPARQEVLRRKLYGLLLGKGLSLGEAIQRAKAEALAEDARTRTVVEGWNLLGDPALRFDEPRGARR